MPTFATFRHAQTMNLMVRGLAVPVALVLLTLGMVRCSDAPQSQPTGVARNPLRVVTWNVQKCEGGVERVTAELARLDADVVCLQEIIEPRDGGDTPNQTRDIAKALRMHAYSYGGKLDEQRNQCLAILSRTPLSDTAALFTVPERNYGVTATVAWQGRRVRIVSVHLAGTYKADVQHIVATTQERAKDWEALQKRLSEWSEPVIVAGDFNMPSSAPVFGTLDRGLRRVAGVGLTFPSPAPFLDLDHVLCSPSLETSVVETVECQVSDHRPLLVAFTLHAQ